MNAAIAPSPQTFSAPPCGSWRSKILAAGMVGSNFAVLRFNPNGTLDTTFNGTGKSFAGFAGSINYVNSMAAGSNSQIVLVGYSNAVAGFGFAVARFNEDGLNMGNQVTPGTGTGEAVAIQSTPPSTALERCW